MAAMAGPWIFPRDNEAYFKEVEFQKGQLVECQLYDDSGALQGHGLWDIREQLEKRKEGIWTRARLVAVSDPHLKWWLDEGPGAQQGRQFNLHLCSGEARQCRKKRRSPELEFHTDYFRCLGAGALTEKKLVWFKDEAARADVQAEISRLAGQKAKKKEERPRAAGQPLAFSESDVGEGGSALAVAPPEGEDVGERLKELRKEIGKVKEGKKKKDKSGGSKKRKPHKKDQRSPAAAADQPMWFGQKKQPEQHDSSDDSADSSDSSSDRQGARVRKDEKKKKERKRERKKRKRDKGAEDRGPFGAGAKVKFARSEATSISSGDDDETGPSFQAAPSGKSRQLQLLEYAEKHPGRLASRLLMKMRVLLAREEGALNRESEPSNLTPSTATSYFLTVMLPLHRERLNLRVQREMRTVAKSLDLIAMGEPHRAADVLAQRLKALELMVSDQSWGRAAHVELLPAEGATLVEPDESWVATREHVFENKLRQWKGKGIGKETDGKGKPRDEKGKGKKGQKWNSRTSWGAAPAEAEQGSK